MAGEIFIADKQTLDSVKSDTSSILTKVNSLPSDYPNVINYSSGKLAPKIYNAGVPAELYKITGEGEVDFICFYQPATNNMNGYIEVYADDVLVYKDGYTSSVRRIIAPITSISYQSGLFCLHPSEDGKTWTTTNVGASGISHLPFITSGGEPTFRVIPYLDKIKFKNSLKVQLRPNAYIDDSYGVYLNVHIRTK